MFLSCIVFKLELPTISKALFNGLSKKFYSVVSSNSFCYCAKFTLPFNSHNSSPSNLAHFSASSFYCLNAFILSDLKVPSKSSAMSSFNCPCMIFLVSKCPLKSAFSYFRTWSLYLLKIGFILGPSRTKPVMEQKDGSPNGQLSSNLTISSYFSSGRLTNVCGLTAWL